MNAKKHMKQAEAAGFEAQNVEPDNIAAEQTPKTFDPDGWRGVIWQITNVFESGEPDGRADAYQNADAGIVSFGKHQATLQSGNLERVLDAYFRRSSSSASQALQQEFAQRVAQREESLRHDGRFKQLLLEAAQEPAMSEAQAEIFAQNFYRPVVEEARRLGIRTPLGLACLYDTRIQGGLGIVVTAVSQKLGVQKVGDTGHAGPVDELTWLRTFLDEREARLNRLADKREREGKLNDANMLRNSTFRVVELRRLLNEGKLDLVGELHVRRHRLQGFRQKAKASLDKQPNTETGEWQMLRNGSFTEGWETLPPLPEAGNLKNQRPYHWQLEWLNRGDHLYDDPNSRVTGIPECVHKLSGQLPLNEQRGAANALILEGDTTYKIFNSSAIFGATLSQTVAGLQPGTQAVLTVPIQVHLHGETDDYGAESGVWVNGQGGWVNGKVMGDRQWYRHKIEFTVPGNGTAEIVIRVKSKWQSPKDFFFDGITLLAEAAGTSTQPEIVREVNNLPDISNEKKMKYVTAEAGLWLRSGPSTANDTLQRMMQGTAVIVLEEKVDAEGLWDFVRLGEISGYAYREYLETKEAAKPRQQVTAKLGAASTTTRLAAGMNINPDAPHSNPLHDGVLRGLDWVRFPYKAADKRRTVAAAFGEYDPIIQGYANQGVGSLVVLNQQTVAGSEAPWPQNNWAGLVNRYADKFAAAAGEIAAHYAHLGENVAYQIWNEGDNPKTPWVSVHVPPEHFAVILSRAAQAIRAASPQSPIVFGGLSTGPDQAAAYVRACRQALGGDLPVDAIGVHPYGRWPIERPFPDWIIGRLDDVFAIFKRAVPDKPLWITEIGIPGHANPIGEQHYPVIAKYLRDMYTMVAGAHAAHVPVIIWFAWSDNMENAGIVTADGRRKAHIFDAFTAVRDRQIVS